MVATGAWAQHPVEYVVLNAATIPLLRCGEFVLPGVVKLVVQQREKRMGRNPATGARVEIPAKQVVKARIAKQLKDVVEA